jgi:hypothetical protein
MPTKKKTTVSTARSRLKTPVSPHAPQPDTSSAFPTAPSPTPPQRTPDEQVLIDAWEQRLQAIPQVAVRETTSKRELRPPTGDHALWAARLAEVLKTDDPRLLAHLLSQVSSCVWKTDAERALNLTVAAVAGIGPRDQLEALLAVQMVSVHNTAMELLRRVLLPDQTIEGVNLGVQRSAKLLRLFTTQMETLLRYRGGGRQTVTVEHVNVNAGGQAIVGTIQAGGRGDEQEK